MAPSDTPLPTARGELSAAVLEALAGEPGRAPAPDPAPAAAADPYGDDLQLALYLCYELHYTGLAGVADEWEWDPGLLRLRQAMERRFLAALRSDATVQRSVEAALEGLLVEPVDGAGVSHHLRDSGELWQMREYIAERSLYHLKEADPHLWVVPRLRGQAKASMAAVEYDEFGAGRGAQVHARLFADLMADLGLETGCGRYLEAGSAQMLAVVNLMSLLGLHRSLRGALVGHFASVEITSSPSSHRMAQALRRMDAGPAAVFFYTEHVEADAVHEQIVRREVIADALRSEPQLAADVAFGVGATQLLDDRLAEHFLTAWREDRSSLRVPI